MELPTAHEQPAPVQQQAPLLERIGDAALYATCYAQLKVDNAVNRLKREGGMIASRVALASLAIAGSAGLFAQESTTAEAASTQQTTADSNTPGASLSFGWNVYVNFNRAATQELARGDNQAIATGALGIAAWACQRVPLEVKPQCEVTTILEGADFEWALNKAQEHNDCLQLKIPYTTYASTLSPAVMALQIEHRVLPVPNFGWAPCKN